jgi:hypothetical protein
MRYLIAGLIAGFAAGILMFRSTGGMEIVPFFYSSLDALDILPQADPRGDNSHGYVVPVENSTWVINRKFQVLRRIDSAADTLTEFSGNGSFYIRYGKVSSEIELFGLGGERYLRMKSREKPFLSHNGELMLLLNGDHSAIRIFDKSGNSTGAGIISGRLCTTISFSEGSDFAACGFADGTYYFLDQKGNIINRGAVRPGDVIKGIAISGAGNWGLVHSGNQDADMLRTVDIADNDFDETELKRAHYVKTAMHISDRGEGAFLDHDALLIIDDDCDIDYRISVPAKRPGYSTLSAGPGFYSLCYTKNSGEAQIIFFGRNGRIMYVREFPGLSFIGASVSDNLVFARGSDSIFGYHVRL